MKNKNLSEWSINPSDYPAELEPRMIIMLVICIISLSYQILQAILYGTLVSSSKNKEEVWGDCPIDLDLTKKLKNIIKDDPDIEVRYVGVRTGYGNMINAWTYGTPQLFYTEAISQILNEKELMAVLIHEYGHYKEDHVTKVVKFNLLSSFAINSLVIIIMGFADTLGISAIILSVIASIFGKTIAHQVKNSQSRKYEFESDSYAKKYGYANHLISAFQKFEAMVKKNICKKLSESECQARLEQIHEASTHPSFKKRIEQLKKKLTFAVASIVKPLMSIRNNFIYDIPSSMIASIFKYMMPKEK